MQIIKDMRPLATGTPTALALGYFDGLHAGHRQVIAHAVKWAGDNGCKPAVFTFVLDGITYKGGRLESETQKMEALTALGTEICVEPAFAMFKDLSPEAFAEYICCKLQAKAVFCGPNFTFGSRAAGKVEDLKKLCGAYGTKVEIVPFALWQGEPVSSTRIRERLAAGDVPAVNAMLGRRYSVAFPVCHGRGLGHTLGVPTINQRFPADFQMPRQGIYATRVMLNGKSYPGATGLSSRPTVNENAADVTCETFIPDFSGDLYGQSPEVEFVQWLSPIQKFDTLDELKNCIFHAAEQSKQIFEKEEL